MKTFIVSLILTVGLAVWGQTIQPPANTSQVTNMVANGYYVSPAGLGDFYNYILVPYVADHAGGNTNALTAGQEAIVNAAVTNLVQGTVNQISGHSLTVRTNYTELKWGVETNVTLGTVYAFFYLPVEPYTTNSYPHISITTNAP